MEAWGVKGDGLYLINDVLGLPTVLQGIHGEKQAASSSVFQTTVGSVPMPIIYWGLLMGVDLDGDFKPDGIVLPGENNECLEEGFLRTIQRGFSLELPEDPEECVKKKRRAPLMFSMGKDGAFHPFDGGNLGLDAANASTIEHFLVGDRPYIGIGEWDGAVNLYRIETDVSFANLMLGAVPVNSMLELEYPGGDTLVLASDSHMGLMTGELENVVVPAGEGVRFVLDGQVVGEHALIPGATVGVYRSEGETFTIEELYRP